MPPPPAAAAHVLTFGRFAGKSVGEVGEVDPGYVAALARSSEVASGLAKAARAVSDGLARSGKLTPGLVEVGRTQLRRDLAPPPQQPPTTLARPTTPAASLAVLASTSWIFRALGTGRPRAATVVRTADGFAVVHAGGTVPFPLDDVEAVVVEPGAIAASLVISWVGGESYRVSGLGKRRIRKAAARLTALIQHQRKVRACLPRLAAALAAFDELCVRDAYLNDRALAAWTSDAAEVVGLVGELDRFEISADAATALARFERCFRDGRALSDARNEVWVTTQLETWRSLFDSVERTPLTEQQRRAVLHNEDRTLVVAGAGTGKTSAVVAKVAHLLASGRAHAKEILLLTYSNQACEEMKERLERRVGVKLEVRTFHGIGKDVIASVEGVQPSLSKMADDDEAFRRALDEIFERLFVADEAFRARACDYFLEYFAPYRSRFECETLGDYFRYLRDQEIRSLQSDKVSA